MESRDWSSDVCSSDLPAISANPIRTTPSACAISGWNSSPARCADLPPPRRERLLCERASPPLCALTALILRQAPPSAMRKGRLSKKSTACVDGGASSPARCRASNFQFEPWQFRPWAKPQNPMDSAPPATPTTICLSFLMKTPAANCAR